MAVTYDLELDRIGVGVTRTTGIPISAFGLTGLEVETDYRLRVRAVDVISGVTIYSAWTAWSDFTTLSVASDITVNLALISVSQTLHAITADVPPVSVITDTYDLRIAEVGVGSNVITGITESNYSLTGLSTADHEIEVRLVRSVDGVQYLSDWTDPLAFTAGSAQPQPITVNLGLITSIQAVHSLTALPAQSLPEIPATHWLVSVIDLSDMSVVQEHVAFTTDIALTGLIQGKNYRSSVTGVSDLGVLSDPVTFDFTTSLAVIEYYTTIISEPEQPLDVFHFTVGHIYNQSTEMLTISGLATSQIESISGSFNGSALNIRVDGAMYETVYGTGEISLLMPDELAGNFSIQINGTGDTLGF